MKYVKNFYKNLIKKLRLRSNLKIYKIVLFLAHIVRHSHYEISRSKVKIIEIVFNISSFIVLKPALAPNNCKLKIIYLNTALIFGR